MKTDIVEDKYLKSVGGVMVRRIETERLIMRRLMPEDYLAMAAWDMDERVYKYLLGSACKTPEEPLAWLPKKDPASKHPGVAKQEKKR